MSNMVQDEAAALLAFEETMKQRIKGQDHVMDIVGTGIRSAKAGLKAPEIPMGIFLFVGPSGVGKTETALGVADLLFGGERFMTSIAMSPRGLHSIQPGTECRSGHRTVLGSSSAPAVVRAATPCIGKMHLAPARPSYCFRRRKAFTRVPGVGMGAYWLSVRTNPTLAGISGRYRWMARANPFRFCNRSSRRFGRAFLRTGDG